MADFLLTTSGDLDLTTNDLQLVTGIQAIRQELQIRYRFFLGEWFLNRNEGTPWQIDVLKKNPNEARVRAMLTEVALGTPGVNEIRSLDIDIASATRIMTVTGEFGALLDGSELVFEPFVVDVVI